MIRKCLPMHLSSTMTAEQSSDRSMKQLLLTLPRDQGSVPLITRQVQLRRRAHTGRDRLGKERAPPRPDHEWLVIPRPRRPRVLRGGLVQGRQFCRDWQPAPLPQAPHRRVAYRNDEDNKGKRITSPIFRETLSAHTGTVPVCLRGNRS